MASSRIMLAFCSAMPALVVMEEMTDRIRPTYHKDPFS